MAGLVLVGITASGTSTVGQRLAERLGLALLDCDLLIEQRTGWLPREIFADHGEGGLRELEEQTVLEALRADGVLALSGGAVVSPAVRKALRTSPAPVVWLDVSVAVATRRLGMAVLGPALLAELRRVLDAQLEQRRAWYQEVSDYTVAVDRRTVEEITGEILGLMRSTGSSQEGR